MIIAIDGPAASGKGTLARRLSRYFDLAHLDTGLMYRAVGVAAQAGGVDFADVPALEGVARALDLETLSEREAELRTAEAGVLASYAAAVPEVRVVLLDAQRRFAGRAGGSVLDGRDIGTVVCPDADVKLFVTANPPARAARRAKELRAAGQEVDEAALAAELAARDERDQKRATAPLAPAENAWLLDTTSMSIDEAFDAARRIVTAALAAKGSASA